MFDNIDWVRTLAGWREVILAIAAATTATVAVIGLKRWQHELRGRANFEVARNLLRCALKVRNLVQASRSALVYAGEFPEGFRNDGQEGTRQKAEAWAHVYNNRWKPVVEAYREFDVQAVEAEALWGSEFLRLRDRLFGCGSTARTAFDAIIDNELHGGADFDADRNFARTVRADAHATGGDNALSAELAATVKAIEEAVKPHLKR